MAVNWQMGLIDSGRNALDYMQAFEAGRKASAEQNAIRTRDAARQRASSQLATGDTQAAQQTALAAGDFDYAKAVGSYSDDQRKALDAEADILGRFATSIKNVPVEQREQAFRAMIPSLRGQMAPEYIRNAWSQLQESGWSDQLLDGYIGQAISVKDALAAAQSRRLAERPLLATPGTHVLDPRTGNPIYRVPFAPRPLTVEDGKTIVEYLPGGGGPASTGAGGTLTVEGVLPHIVAQESGGDYTSRNRETGALGAYQVMPQTGKALAERLGLPWRPDLMTSATPEARQYQDKIGAAAIQEAIDNSGGDLATAAMYYHGGSNRELWGPRTQQYAKEVVARASGGGGARVIASGGPRRGWRTLSPQEAQSMGFPAGPVYQQGPDGEIKTIAGTAAAANAGGLTRQQAGLAKSKIQNLRAIEAQISRVERALQGVERGGNTGFFMGRIPGALDPESDVFDKAVAGLAPLIRQLTRVPGEGAMSDYESRLAEATLPKRSDTPEGRREAIATMRELIRNAREGYEELLGQGGTAPTSRPSGGGRKPSVSNW